VLRPRLIGTFIGVVGMGILLVGYFFNFFFWRTETRGVIMEIKVLGPGCAKCRQTEKIIQEMVTESGLAVEVKKVTDMMEIAGYGVFTTPAVVVDGEVKSAGKVPTKAMVKGWLSQ
jgi:small redox-active disulfide protein 2